MRNLKAKDIAPFTKILSKMELKDMLSQMLTNTGKKKDPSLLTASLISAVIDNYYKAEPEFFVFLGDLNSMTPEEVSELDASKFIDLVKELFGVGNLGFFKSAAK